MAHHKGYDLDFASAELAGRKLPDHFLPTHLEMVLILKTFKMLYARLRYHLSKKTTNHLPRHISK